MLFSMVFEAQLADPTPQNERQLMHDCVEQAVQAEKSGFDRIWAVEHHGLRHYAHMSAPEIFLATVAAKTSRIRIGHGVVCMPFNYNFPTRVCERAAMLDIMSNGRLDLGAGRGGTRQEMALCNVDPERTYQEVEEALQIIGRAWTKEDFEWEGKLLTIKPPRPDFPMTIVPRPVQMPHPPLFMACTKPDTVAKAAEYGVGALVLGFAGHDSIREQRAIYDNARAERTGEQFVSTVVNDHFSALCPTIVLEDGAKAKQIGARGQRFFGEAIKHWSSFDPVPNADTENDDNVAVMNALKQGIYDRYDSGENIPPAFVGQRTMWASSYNVDHAYGTVADAIQYVQGLAEAGVDEVMCLIQMGTVPQWACLETIRLWGEQIIPHFRTVAQARAS